MPAVTIADLRLQARRRLPRMLFDYIDGGSYRETTLAENEAAFDRIKLRQRVLRDVSRLDTGVTLFGRALSMPVILGPVGMTGMYARRGEVQAARAAQAAGVPFTLSTVGICGVEETAAAVEAPIWFQLYMLRDRGFMQALLERALAAGCRTLLFTVDLPRPGARYRDARNGLSGGGGLAAQAGRALEGLSHPGWMYDVWLRGRPHVFGSVAPAVPQAKGVADFLTWLGGSVDAAITWADLDWLRARWPGEILIKGVLDPEDARLAIQAGFDGVIVSNHGGRQLDGAPASIEALPAIVQAVGGAAPVLMDGGVRSGLDVLRALALGADAVLLGRAWVWGLSARGQAGVSQVLSLIRTELHTAMALTGVTRLDEGGLEAVLHR